MSSRKLTPIHPGIHVPIITPFNDDADQSIDIATHKKHILYLAKAGVQGVVCQGSTAEAVALTPDERIAVCTLRSASLERQQNADAPGFLRLLKQREKSFRRTGMKMCM